MPLTQAELDAMLMVVRNLPMIAHELKRIADAAERIAESLEEGDDDSDEEYITGEDVDG